MKTKGVRLERKKDPTLLNTLKRPYAVKSVRVPLYGGSGAKLVPCVKPGDPIQVGQKIADPEGNRGVPVFSGIAGKLERFLVCTMPNGERVECAEITGDREPKNAPAFAEIKKDANSFSKEELLRIFRDAGLLSACGSMEPVHQKILDMSLPIQTIKINACEAEPYITARQCLIKHFPLEFLKGAELLRKAADAEKIVLLFSAADRELFEFIKSKIYLLKLEAYEVRIVPEAHPFGQDVFIEKQITANEMLFDVATAYAAYESAYLQKPFFERIVSVGGECVVEPRNFWLPLGLSFDEAIHFAKGFLREPGKVLMGGPMTGSAQVSLDVPVVPATDAILALPKEIVNEDEEEPCVQCNRCVDLCPVKISPAMITLAAEHGEYRAAKEWGVDECVECGICAYVCPSKRPMAALIKTAKNKTEALA